MAVILLIDNGSVRANATLQLRQLANDLSVKTGKQIEPVSLRHANRIPATELDNIPAQVFTSFIKQQLELGEREFILLPLFFGKSQALTSYIPQQVAQLKQHYGDFKLQLADVIYPVPEGEILLTDIIYQHIVNTAQHHQLALQNIVLVDHGSPSPQVTAVRKHLADTVQHKLGDQCQLEQAVMERREGAQYDFNGELLENWLTQKAQAGATSAVVVLLFFLAGRHAGDGGDIAEICTSVMEKFPAFRIVISPLISEHTSLLSILESRLAATDGPQRLPCRGCTSRCQNYPFCDGKPWRMDT